MPKVRITGNKPSNIHKTQFLGALELDKQGQLERTPDVPEPVLQAIEKGVAQGLTEGFVSMEPGLKYEWFFDR